MKKNKILMLTLFSLVLASCSPTSSEQTSSSDKFSSEPISSVVSSVASHTITFMADNENVRTVTFYEGDTSVTEPSVPSKNGYKGKWENYTLGTEDIVVNAIYEAITYTATFKNGNTVVGEVEYTIENYDSKQAPAVPTRDGYIGRWSPNVDFSLLENKTYTAVYEIEDLKIKNGNFAYENESFIANADNSLAIVKDMQMSKGTISTTMKKSIGGEDSGIVFGVTYADSEIDNYWEGAGVSYYFFFVSMFNCAYLAKSDNGVWKQLGRIEMIQNYNEENDYPISVSYENGYIRCFVGEDCLVKYQDSNPLTGTGVGYRAQKEGTSYGDITVVDTVKKDSRDTIDGYTVASGTAEMANDKIKTTRYNTILVDNNLRLEDGKMFSTRYKPTVAQDAGMIIALKDEGYRTFWEEGSTTMEYYYLCVNFFGALLLAKVGSTTNENIWTTVLDNNNIKDYNVETEYELGVVVEGTIIKCYVDGMLVHTYDTGRALAGNMVGVRAAAEGAEFTRIIKKEKPTGLEWYQRSGSFVKGDDGSLISNCDGSLAFVNNEQLTSGKSFSVDITASEASDTGIIFGCSNAVTTRWEENPYYFFFVNGGNDALLAGPVNGWSTFANGGNVADKMNPYGEANTLRVEIKDNYNIVCYVNGHEVINVTITEESQQLSGTYFGVRCAGQGMRKFENFQIK